MGECHVKISEKEYQYRKDYNKNAYDQIKFVSRKEDKLKDRIEAAANIHGVTASKYMIQAIEKQLQADGITPDMLPEQEQ